VVEMLRALLDEVAPRGDGPDVTLDTDLGYGGYGMTAPEYLTLLHRVEHLWGVQFGDTVWPHTLRDIVECRVRDMAGTDRRVSR
jgi:hypothetical protein